MHWCISFIMDVVIFLINFKWLLTYTFFLVFDHFQMAIFSLFFPKGNWLMYTLSSVLIQASFLKK